MCEREREKEDGRESQRSCLKDECFKLKISISAVNLAYNEILGSDSISSLNPRSRWITSNF